MTYLELILNNEKYLQDFITRSTYNSNAIEGSTLSMNETYALLFDSNHCLISDKSAREIYEAINHKHILMKLFDHIKYKDKFSKELLIEINQTINESIIYVGGYRMGPVRIIGSEKTFPMPFELDEIMNKYINEINYLFNQSISMKDIAKMHNDYENIHPFPDGNGRTGRLMINYLLLSNNMCPIVIPMSKRKEYLEYMENNDIESLASLFEELQKEEEKRINDFMQM